MVRAVVIGIAALAVVGCQTAERPREQFGKVYYLDGAGNLGFGTQSIPSGLAKAGFKGDVETVRWSQSVIPIVDQIDENKARREGAKLAHKIADYKQRYPHQPVHIIALSAGTGVAMWACEQLPSQVEVDNVVMLGSSLSHDYEAGYALQNVRGHMFFYHSDRDAVLPTTAILGTIDGETDTRAAGQVGLRPPAGMYRKVVNVGWSEPWMAMGWNGGHTDCTKRKFVENVISRNILPKVKLVGQVNNGAKRRRPVKESPSDT